MPGCAFAQIEKLPPEEPTLVFTRLATYRANKICKTATQWALLHVVLRVDVAAAEVHLVRRPGEAMGHPSSRCQ